MKLGLSRIILFVVDLPKMLAFYRDVIPRGSRCS
jgi:hypothetical protein